MKIAFIIPILDEINLQKTFNRINEACDVDYDIFFAINGKLNSFFTQVRTTFLTESRVKAFMVDRPVNQHKLITLGMQITESYDATIIYSGKEEPNVDVIRAFLASWKAGNKIVYLKKVYSGFKKMWVKIKRGFYRLGIKMLGIFNDRCAETDIQLLDSDVVKTINQLPAKNRQLRVLDSFVGYQTDVIQLEIDSKTKENKNYEDKIKAVKVSGATSLSFFALALLSVIAVAIGIGLRWTISPAVYIIFIAFSLFALTLSYVFATKRVLHFRVGQVFELSELTDLKNKLEKYNITNKKTD